ncbi:hypothetical protein ACJX0J_030443, partial [Zea mays]
RATCCWDVAGTFNDMNARADIKGIIQTPVATSFGYKKPMLHYMYKFEYEFGEPSD